MNTTAIRRSDVVRLAGDLRIVIGQLVRRLRVEQGFPISQMAVLSRLSRDGAHTTSELAKAERMRPQSMAQIVGELESMELVERRADPEDGRRVLLELTSAGRARVREERRRREGWLNEAILTELTREEQRLLVQALPLLERIANR
jgi:DNA-binding MarR family transcriptional regulator